MVQQRLAPGVEHGRETQVRAEVVAPESQHGFGGGAKEQVIERLLVLGNERVELVGQSKDQVEVRDGQQQAGLGTEPVLAVGGLAGGTVAVAAAVGGEVRAA